MPQLVALLKCIFLISCGYGVHVAFTPPHPPSKQPVEAKLNFLETKIRVFSFAMKTMYWILVLSEILETTRSAVFSQSTLARGHSVPSMVKWAYSFNNKTSNFVAPSLTFYFLVVLVISGSIIRANCYKALGEQFSFEIGVKANHRLVTHGPYAITRHPSYASLEVLAWSGTGIFLTKGCYIRRLLIEGTWEVVATCASSKVLALECGADLWSNSSRFNMFILTVLITWTYLLLRMHPTVVGRITREEELLKLRFGKEWEDYTRRVRFKLLPGIL